MAPQGYQLCQAAALWPDGSIAGNLPQWHAIVRPQVPVLPGPNFDRFDNRRMTVQREGRELSVKSRVSGAQIKELRLPWGPGMFKTSCQFFPLM